MKQAFISFLHDLFSGFWLYDQSISIIEEWSITEMPEYGCLPVLGKWINSIATRRADYAPRFLNGAASLSHIIFINFENKCVHMYIINAMEYSIPNYDFMVSQYARFFIIFFFVNFQQLSRLFGFLSFKLSVRTIDDVSSSNSKHVCLYMYVQYVFKYTVN